MSQMTKSDILRQAHQMAQAGQAEAASQRLAQLVQAYPQDPDFTHHAGLLLLGQPGKLDAAILHLQRSVTLAPAQVDYRSNYATALNMRGRHAEAAVEYRRAVAIRPDFFAAQLGLASALIATQDYDSALSAAQQASALDPRRPEPWVNMAIALIRSGRGAQAMVTLEKALTRLPDHPILVMQLVSNLHYRPEIAPQRIRAEHERLGRLVAQSLGAHSPAPFSNSRDADRPLRVGYLSPDFRDHSITHFFRPILQNHDAAHAQPYLYSAVQNPDETTAALQALAPQWRDVSRTSDPGLEELIRGDQIDILVDLAGHTGGSRVIAMARRLAPVQISYLGYPNTTGLPNLDYRIVDSLTDPAGAEAFSTEQLIRLDPCFLCYQPNPGAPEPRGAGVPPADRPITFCSFNSAQKLVEPVIQTWADLLKAVPGSRLLLKTPAFDSEPTRRDYLKHFERSGVSADRLELRGRIADPIGHLAAYNEADIALDPFPYNGTTTTFEALDMVVPVVTLEGQAHAGRVGVSILTNLGLQDLIAKDPADYIAKAQSLAQAPSRLSQLRATLRDRLRSSPLCDAPAFTRRLESAYREAWRRYCRSHT